VRLYITQMSLDSPHPLEGSRFLWRIRRFVGMINQNFWTYALAPQKLRKAVKSPV